MDKKYQVFVSSTFDDLREERALIYDTLLRLGCFPSGMEQFPAADEEQLKVIGKLIEQCDYYILIVAGRYGSTTRAGKSYTEAEYELAIEKGIPVLAFVHDNPGATVKNDTRDATKWAALLKFRERVMDGRLNAIFKDKSDLAVKVMQSLTDAFNSKPRTGWVRGDRLVSDSAAREILELKQQVDHWKSLADDADRFAKFANGTDAVELTFKTRKQLNEKFSETEIVKMTWDSIFNLTCDQFFAGKTVDVLENVLAHAVQVRLQKEGKLPPSLPTKPALRLVEIQPAEFYRVIVQFNALGLIGRNLEGRWTLTEFGEDKYYELRAMRKENA